MEYKLTIDTNKNDEFNKFINSKLREFNDTNSKYHREYREPGEIIYLNIIVESETNECIGGLTAELYWGWLNIKYLWVHDDFRTQRIGSKVLMEAEKVALSNNCIFAQLNTYSFQARAFYEKQGYQIIGELKNYPPGCSYYWMRKDLVR